MQVLRLRQARRRLQHGRRLAVANYVKRVHPRGRLSHRHILPVIFFFHFGEQLNDVGHAGKGGLDPDEFWHAWARGAEMTVDIFDPTWSVWDWVEHDLDELRRRWNVTPPGNRR
jgi:hypothetical protein